MTKAFLVQKDGFQITFSNKWSIRVCFGALCYCENRNEISLLESIDDIKSKDAQIQIWNADGKEYNFGQSEPRDGTVKGWCSADEVADFIIKTKNGSLEFS